MFLFIYFVFYLFVLHSFAVRRCSNAAFISTTVSDVIAKVIEELTVAKTTPRPTSGKGGASARDGGASGRDGGTSAKGSSRADAASRVCNGTE